MLRKVSQISVPIGRVDLLELTYAFLALGMLVFLGCMAFLVCGTSFIQ